MKKYLLLTFLFACSIISVAAQTPEKKSRAVVFKFTESWCGPCGTWGWNLGNKVVDSIGDNGYYVGVMGSSDTLNANCWSPFQSNFSLNGYPTFVVNDYKTLDFFSSIKGKYEQFAALEPLASPAGYASISGNSISVATKTKFWSADSGEFYLAAFLIEDKVRAKQFGQTGVVEHHFIMRGSMMPNLSPWGQRLDSGAVAANTEYSKSFSMSLDTRWVKSNLSILLVVYKKVGRRYLLVNAMKAGNQPTGVNAASSQMAMTVFPNPATNQFNIKLKLPRPLELSVRVYDIIGREVCRMPPSKYSNDESIIQLQTFNLPNGVYNAVVYGDNTRYSEKVIIYR